MLQTSESETEILLGNKQLFGIFIVIAVLVGIAFTGGYFVGRSSATAKASANAATSTPTLAGDGTGANSSITSGSAAETRTIPPESSTNNGASSSTESAELPSASSAVDDEAPAASPTHDHPLGSSKRGIAAKKVEPETTVAQSSTFAPQTGQTFLQVAAVKRDEAEAVADVLHKKGFRAHAVAKPGNAAIYRVLIGPVNDAGDLSATRDLLRKTGFREVIVQKY